MDDLANVIFEYLNTDLKKYLKYDGTYVATIENSMILITDRSLPSSNMLYDVLKSHPEYVTILKKGFIDLFNRYLIPTTDVDIRLHDDDYNPMIISHVNRKVPILAMDLPLY